ncbi:MAG TPA: 23S rRNA (pseudouridine(1915)-N(3))-methyltransferase RlmH [Flavobacteriales bacterium]|nr:23S rRNA (pseudouridine(1915)-N(3))-methyltransferase RlmH [Flavobacteriales bacterium]
MHVFYKINAKKFLVYGDLCIENQIKILKIKTLQIGSVPAEIKSLCAEYEKRLARYGVFEQVVLNDVKNAASLPVNELKKKEWEQYAAKIPKGAQVVLLDEGGKEFSSVEFAGYIQQQQLGSVKELVFIIGGAYGFDPEAYKTARMHLSLARMTFSHQLVRLVFMEQLYRAFTIIRGEKYHH